MHLGRIRENVCLFISFLVNKTFRFLNYHLKVTFKFSCDVFLEEKIFITEVNRSKTSILTFQIFNDLNILPQMHRLSEK